MKCGPTDATPGLAPLGGGTSWRAKPRPGAEVLRGLRVATVLAAAALFGACSDVIVPTGCGSPSFVVNATLAPQRTRPQYSWDAGPAFELRVSRASDPIFAAWRIAADDPSTGFASPVNHGTVPDGARFIDGDESTLRSGVRYCVTVTLLAGQEGTSEFQP